MGRRGNSDEEERNTQRERERERLEIHINANTEIVLDCIMYHNVRTFLNYYVGCFIIAFSAYCLGVGLRYDVLRDNMQNTRLAYLPDN